MPQPKNTVPSYLHHKPSGQAFIRLPDGKGGRRVIYLGKFNSSETRAEYGRVVTELSASPLSGRTSPTLTVTVNELLLAFWRFAEKHYRRSDDTPTDELAQYRQTFRPLRELYGHVPAVEFGPKALKALRQWMIVKGWTRKLVNQRVGRVKRVFKWAASEELIPVAVHQALATVTGLQAGRTEARDTDPVQPVPDATVDAVLPYLSRHVRGLVEFQRLTGCRPGEACKLRRCDLVTAGAVWLYTPPLHKTRHRGKTRTIAVGPRAQALLVTFPTDLPTECLFSPAKAVAEFRAARSAARKTSRYKSHVARNASVSVPNPKRVPGKKYTLPTYEHAVARACEKAGVPHWSPNQLRHNYATKVRRDHGLEAAQVLLGHERADVTQVYAERDSALANEIALKIG